MPDNVDVFRPLRETAGLGMQLYNLKLMNEDRLLKERSLAESAREHNIGAWGTEQAQPGVPTLQQRAIQAHEATIPSHRQMFGYGDEKLYQGIAKQFGIPDNSPISQYVKEMASDPRVDRISAYQILANRDDLRQSIADSIKFNPDDMNTPEGKKKYDLLQQISTPEGYQQLLGKLFGATLQSYQSELASKKNVPTKEQIIGAYGQSLLTDAAKFEAAANQPGVSEADKNFLIDRAVKIRATAHQVLGITKEPKEVNVANEIDTILGGMFPGYYTDPTVRQKALNYYATPEGSQKVQAAAQKYSAGKAPPIYNMIQTDQGFVPVSGRTGIPGTPTGFGSKTPESEIKTGTYLDTMGAAINRIKDNYSSNFVGPIAGRFGQTAESWMNLPEQQVTFYADVNDIKDQLLRARSGAQINEQEYKRLVKFLPDATNPEKNFISKLNRFEQELADIARGRARELESGGYKKNKNNANNRPPLSSFMRQ